MSKKSQSAYEHAFKYVETKLFKLSSAASFTTDYEIAMRNALVTINSNAEMFACLFHYCQALKRRASQTDGLVQLIRTNKTAESIYYRLQCLPILPVGYILTTFKELKKEAIPLKNRSLNQFFAYFKKQWIEKVGYT